METEKGCCRKGGMSGIALDGSEGSGCLVGRKYHENVAERGYSVCSAGDGWGSNSCSIW